MRGVRRRQRHESASTLRTDQDVVVKGQRATALCPSVSLTHFRHRRVLGRIFTSPAHANQIAAAFERLRAKVEARLVARSAAHGAVSATSAVYRASSTAPRTAADGAPDYSAFTLEDPSQFAMAWTTFEDVFRRGFPHVTEYCAAITDPKEATRQFWPTLRSNALPYNLLVLQKLTPASAMSFRNNLGLAWLPTYDELLDQGRLYGIDMTIFSGLDPQEVANGTVRFTPSTMALLEMDEQKNRIRSRRTWLTRTISIPHRRTRRRRHHGCTDCWL